MLWFEFLYFVPLLIGIALVIAVLLRRRPRSVPAEPIGGLPDNAIVVDGSNIMHWGEDASALVLSRVLQEIVRKGYNPVIFFDASVGYKLGDRYFDECKLAEVTGIPQNQICVVNKGVVADEWILMFATDHGLRIVTNDLFRDWRVPYPHADKKGVLVGGTWRDGAVVWRGKL